MNEKQETFQKEIAAQLEQCATWIDEVKTKAQQAEGPVKIKYYDHLEDLRIRERGARLKLAECERTKGENWEGVKSDVEAAVRSLKDGLEEDCQR